MRKEIKFADDVTAHAFVLVVLRDNAEQNFAAFGIRLDAVPMMNGACTLAREIQRASAHVPNASRT